MAALVETSGKGQLNFTGQANLLAPHGVTGTLLLDPSNVTISGTATSNDAFSSGTYTPTVGATTSNILNTDLQSQLATANVQVLTTSS